MRVLVACEESQRVCIEFRKLGHEAYSCDLQECSGGHPEWHIQRDVLEVVKDGCWDLMIAHPPCTYLSNVGNAYFNEEKYGDNAKLRKQLRLEAFDFVMKLLNAPIPKIALENPIGYINTNFRKPDQIIHPYYFGEPYKKATCLWLKNLQTLRYDNTIIEEPKPVYVNSKDCVKSGMKINWCDSLGPSKDRAKIRSKTFVGIAKAFAAQWGNENNTFEDFLENT